MGFYTIDERAAVLESCQENPVPPSKNRVWNFFTTSETCAGFFESQPVEPHQEKWPTPTTTASGVRFYGYRYYHPETGRWVNRDPIGEAGGANLYCTLKNNCPNWIDPDGRAPWSPSVTDYGDGFYSFEQGYWLFGGRPYWDPSTVGSGATVLKVLDVQMMIVPCTDGTGCHKLQLNYAYGATWMWYTIWFSYNHEIQHVGLWHKRYIKLKNYAHSVERCYKTNEEANCWKDCAENKARNLHGTRGLLENYGFDGISSGSAYASAVSAEASATAEFINAEATCTAMATP